MNMKSEEWKFGGMEQYSVSEDGSSMVHLLVVGAGLNEIVSQVPVLMEPRLVADLQCTVVLYQTQAVQEPGL
jgi:hypothetical protein